MKDQTKPMIENFKAWLNEKGYRQNDPRFCTVPDRIPGIRPIPDPQNVTPVSWGNIANPYKPVGA